VWTATACTTFNRQTPRHFATPSRSCAGATIRRRHGQVRHFHGCRVDLCVGLPRHNRELFRQTDPNLATNKPVCTDCHGVHEISRVDDPQTGLSLKENLLVRCQRCHPDATSDFPDAWLSHYVPSPEHYPIVFYVDLFYRIFIRGIGGMLVFGITSFAA
jgi:hypothetical protein